ncbi:putative lipid II flippase FtsW [Oerskovia flava]|uniref:putative lipid II flippase FtsW n=1 Tax=Oerskovia flava TaxID=2986422 RepID=UPI00224063CF|nr:putative lipid II flippase FtsW [Oerskovia sp. JB1-3-2]
MAQTTSRRPATDARAGTVRRPVRRGSTTSTASKSAGSTAAARSPARSSTTRGSASRTPRAATERARRPETASSRPWLGQWNSTVTSYYLLIGATTLLAVIGLVMVLSSSAVTSISDGSSAYGVFLRQAQFALIGVPLMIVATRLPVTFYRRFSWVFLLGALGLQMLVFTPLARGEGGNTGWVYVAGISFQPAEFAKLALAVWLGAVLGRKQRLLGSWSHALIPAAPGVLLVFGLVMAGHDLGTALVVALLAAGAFFVAGIDLRLFVGAAVVGAAAIVGFFVVGQAGSNRMERIASTYGAACDTANECYQSQHGLWALGTGGFSGVGLGASREKWNYLPAAHNDFIFSVIGEELGLLGTLLVLALFAVLGLAMSRVVRRHPDPFVKITTAAIACWVVGQAFINIGVVIGLLPVIGIPLPLVSAGGSALIVTLIAMGVVISFARTEPGAAEALAARGSVVRRSLGVVGRAGRAGRARMRRR